MRLTLSLHLPSLALDFEAAVREAVALGFTHIDVAALVDRPPQHLEALADAGVIVAAADITLSSGLLLDARRQVADAARLGATVCCLHPDAHALLEEYAAARMVRLCSPGLGGLLLDTASRIAHVRLDAHQDESAVRSILEVLRGADYRGAVAIRWQGSREGVGAARALLERVAGG